MDVIGELLRDGLLTSLGTDGDRAGFLREAVDRLAACLGGDDLLLFPAAVMLAAGEDVDLKDAVTGVTRDCILESWETFTNAFTDEPTEIFRAVATGAVANAADTAGTRLALAGWYQIRTAMEMLEPGRTWPQLDALRGRWCEIGEAEALRRWQPAAVSAQLRMPSVATVEDGTFDIATDVAATAARVFTDSGGAAQNFSAHLMPVFADMVQGLISYSDEVALEAHRRSVDVVKELAGALGGKLREVVAAQEQTLSAATLRNDLLW